MRDSSMVASDPEISAWVAANASKVDRVETVDGVKLVAGTAIPRLDSVTLGWPMLALVLLA